MQTGLIERAFAHNLLDFVQTSRRVTPGALASSIPCAGGIAAFLGRGSPLTVVKGAGPEIEEQDFEAVEEFFRLRGIETALFELAPWITPATADRLARRGYSAHGSENVLVRAAPFQSSPSPHEILTLDPEQWIQAQLAANENLDPTLWTSLFETCAHLPDAVRLGVPGPDGNWIGCAELLPVPGFAIFGNDATRASARNQGVQTATIGERLRRTAALSLEHALAEVAPGSTSERNYLRCGFRIAYTRTHYARSLR